MRRVFQKVISLFRVPLVRIYLSSERQYRTGNISVTVRPGVFHPGLFPSTGMILKYLLQQELTGKSLLELGCGTGLISIAAEKKGAVTTASDISTAAIESTKLNAAANGSQITVIHSDLFEKIPTQAFDWIVINPPYYARDPETEAEHAWYCGANFEYFKKLFPDLKNYISKNSFVLMTLTKDSDVASITAFSKDAGFRLELLLERRTWLEGTDYLFRVRPW